MRQALDGGVKSFGHEGNLGLAEEIMERRDDPAVIEPRRGSRESMLPPDCLMVFTPQDRELVQQSLDAPLHRTHKVFLVEVGRGRWRGLDLALAGPMMGAPQAVLTLDKLTVLGVRRILALGWCGSLQPHVRIGDVVLPTGALSEEGTSAHYPLDDGVDPGPSVTLLDGLARALEGTGADLAADETQGTPGSECTQGTLGPHGTRPGGGDGLKVHRGRVWSIDAPYRETVRKVLRYQGEGILGVDMETSALFTAARYRGIALASILVVSDDLSTLQWVHGFKAPEFLRARKRAVRAVLETFQAVRDHEK